MTNDQRVQFLPLAYSPTITLLGMASPGRGIPMAPTLIACPFEPRPLRANHIASSRRKAGNFSGPTGAHLPCLNQGIRHRCLSSIAPALACWLPAKCLF